MRHVLSISDWSRSDVQWIVDTALQWKSRERAPLDEQGPHGVLILERPSFRTRIAYEGALHLLNGQLTVFEGGVGTTDSIGDISRVLSEMLDFALIRTRDHSLLEQIAERASVPIINALSNREHPVEVLADALTIHEHFGHAEGLRLAFVGDGGNVCASMLQLGALLGMHVAVASPEGFLPDERILDQVSMLAKQQGTEFRSMTDPIAAVEKADIVYTDGWPSFDSEDEKERVFGPYRVTERLMGRAAPAAIFLHCLPAARGVEVTNTVLDSGQSLAFHRLGNLVFTSAAMIEWALGRDSS